MLPHESFRRLGCHNHTSNILRIIKKTTILHCLSKKTLENKEEISRDLDTWQLSDNWKEILYNDYKNIDKYLQKIKK